MMEGQAVENFYRILLTSPTASALSARSHLRPTDLLTWHRRFCHAGNNAIRLLASKDMVEGLTITGDEPSGLCKDCIMGKHARRPFDKIFAKETQVLERVHIDLWGPSPVKSIGGKTYLMSITNGALSYAEVFFLPDKTMESTLAAFRLYHISAERQTGRKLLCARINNGTESIN